MLEINDKVKNNEKNYESLFQTVEGVKQRLLFISGDLNRQIVKEEKDKSNIEAVIKTLEKNIYDMTTSFNSRLNAIYR